MIDIEKLMDANLDVLIYSTYKKIVLALQFALNDLAKAEKRAERAEEESEQSGVALDGVVAIMDNFMPDNCEWCVYSDEHFECERDNPDCRTGIKEYFIKEADSE